MFIVSVIPLSRNFSADELTYFSSKEVSPGSLVSVPLRKQNVPALVASVSAAKDAKSALRKGQFALKRITAVRARKLFSPAFMKAAERFALWHGISLGAALAAVVPKMILENSEKIRMEDAPVREAFILAMQLPEDERTTHYRSLIREEFARKRSVFFAVPTAEDTKRAFANLSRGIEDYAVVITNSMGKKAFAEALSKINKSTHPLLIISTPYFISLARKDTGVVALEREASRAYRTQKKPLVNMKRLVLEYAKASGTKLVLGDTVLSVETLHGREEEAVGEFGQIKFRSPSSGESALITMSGHKADTGEADSEAGKKDFRIFSEELMGMVEKTRSESGRVFLFGARKGYSGTTVCNDCEETVTCNVCQAPVVLYRKQNPYYLCHKCGEKRSADTKCKRCGGWRLTALGIGVERIEEELMKKVPASAITRIDSDTTPTAARAALACEKWLSTPGGILIGTELALYHIPKQVEAAAVVSADSLFGIPDIRINEKIMSVLLKVRSLAAKRFIIQTRLSELSLFHYALKGNILDFYREEIGERRRFAYPPFSIFIKLSSVGPKSRTTKDEVLWKEVFGDEVHIMRRGDGNAAQSTGLLKVDSTKWPDKEIVEKLRSMPPWVSVEVDPNNFF